MSYAYGYSKRDIEEYRHQFEHANRIAHLRFALGATLIAVAMIFFHIWSLYELQSWNL